MTTLPGCSTRTPLNRRPSFRWMLLLALILLLAAMCVASICVGSVSLTPGQVWSALVRPDEAATATQIVRVRVEMFGRETPVELEVCQVERV